MTNTSFAVWDKFEKIVTWVLEGRIICKAQIWQLKSKRPLIVNYLESFQELE